MNNIQKNPIKELFARPSVIGKFNEILGEKRATQFVTSVMQVATSNKLLAKADPVSIYNAAAMAAVLDLPINNNLGFAWIVPYGDQAQFQMGYRGFVQLAMRSGQYERINVIKVHENQFSGFNYLTEELIGDFTQAPSGEVVGYAAYMRTINGFEKLVYWSKAEVEAHGKRFSKSYSSGPWKTDFDAMAMKTVLKHMLSHWGILSVEIQKAVVADQSVIHNAETEDVEYVDNPEGSFSENTTAEPEQKELPRITDQGIRKFFEEANTIEQLRANFELTANQEIVAAEISKSNKK